MHSASELAPTVDVTKEYRIAVVMYGGISLAIYMNGIAHELLAMVRSTADGVHRESTEAIYRKLALKLSEENDGGVHTKFVIDIISGTSAGGINGVFLAKALAHGASLDALKTVWVEEGDFQKLLNDQTHPDIQLDRQIPPRSLLSGERMYVKLFEAFAEMDSKPRKPLVENLDLWVTATDLAGRIVPLRLSDRVVWERKYRQVFPLRYDKDSEVDDFIVDNTPFLAFAARCTSSFPIAFEPMQMAAVPDLIRASSKYGRLHDRTDEEWKNFFTKNWQRFFGTPDDGGDPGGDGTDWERYFADGGYLDNHPFDHAIASLSQQSSPVHAQRKLFYIEPSPEHPELARSRRDKRGKLLQPDAFENAWDGLAGIPGKQPIRDSLLQIQQRNRFIRKINYVISDMSLAIEQASQQGAPAQAGPNHPPRGTGERGDQGQMDPRFRAYTTLNVFSVTDDLAIRIARIIGFDESSDYVYAIRCVIKAWRKQEYPDDAQFLLDFDISYRIRRLRFVKSQLEYLNTLSDGAKERLTALNAFPEVTEISEFRNEILELRGVLDKSFRRIRKASLLAQRTGPPTARPDGAEAVSSGATAPENSNAKSHHRAVTIQELIQRLGIVPDDLNEVLGVDRERMERDRQNMPLGSKPGELAPMPVLDDKEYDKRAEKLLNKIGTSNFQVLRDAVVAHYRPEMAAARIAVAEKLGELPSDSRVRGTVKRLGRLYFEQFWQFDAAIFPITYGTDVGDLMEAEVVRISPEDAIAIQNESNTRRPKLAGASFGAFGAFLERVWRRNDILWGRLDAAERIISALGSAVLSKQEIDDLVREAHDMIIKEELKPQDRDEICQMLVQTAAADPRQQRRGAKAPARPPSGSTGVREGGNRIDRHQS